MKKWIKQLRCRHEWKWYQVNEPGLFHNIRGERRVQACPKCEKVKRGSGIFVEYEGRGYK
jgi:hypothetical protein